MSIEKQILVNTQYTRSANLERDIHSATAVSSYIPTSRCTFSLQQISNTFQGGSAPRSWALIGPYGSGKSSFGIFLSELLGDPSCQLTINANKVLSSSDKALAKRIKSETAQTRGYCRVLITGSPEPLLKKFVHSMANAAKEYWEGQRGRPQIINALMRAAEKDDLTPSEVLDLLDNLTKAVVNAKGKNNGKGVLIVIDELGKFLEYEARHYGANDIYFLQALAEYAYKAEQAEVLFVAMLHQAFEQYAKDLGKTLRDEWGKVQGRFENIPFLESSEQTIRIISKAIEQNINRAEREAISSQCKKIVSVLADEKALPEKMGIKQAEAMFIDSYPLHPLTVLILPKLCQKVAQNERTVFSYLGSHEPFGFKSSLQKLDEIGQWIMPWDIYDYFIQNYPSTMNDVSTRHRWAEVVTALERYADSGDTGERILKTIGILNIIGANGGLKPSKKILGLCSIPKAKFSSSLKELESRSLVQFRKFSNEYRVWQGTDFDLEAVLQQEVQSLIHANIAEALNSECPISPVVARKYSIKTGTLRYFEPCFADVESYKSIPKKNRNPRIVFFLQFAEKDYDIFKSDTQEHFSSTDLLAFCPKGEKLKNALLEVLALKRIRINSQELNSDPVASKEHKVRLDDAESRLSTLVQSLLDEPSENQWLWNGKSISIASRRSLQVELSNMLESVYTQCPIIKNELINRDKPSSQANAARNKLVYHLLNHSDLEDLGIEKFPPEKAMYRALFKATNLHRCKKGEWLLTAPSLKSDEYNFAPTWAKIRSLFEKSENSSLPFDELVDELSEPPYGLKLGVIPLFLIAAITIDGDELAIYENGEYLPRFSDEHVERFLKRTSDFSVQRFRIQGLKASIFKEYHRALYGDEKPSNKQSIISIVQPIAKFLSQLPDVTKNTKKLSPKAMKVRDAFNFSKTPQELLFVKLPKACGYSVVPTVGEQPNMDGFSKSLMSALRDLKNFFPELKESQKGLLCNAFNLDAGLSLDKLREKIAGRYSGLENYTVDLDGLRAFIGRLSTETGSSEQWLNNILLFLGRKPIEKWTDIDTDSAEYRLSQFSIRLKDLESLRIQHEKNAQTYDSELDVILLKTVRKGFPELETVVTLDGNMKKLIHDLKVDILANTSSLDKNARLALLAELVNEVLGEDSKVEPNRRKRSKNE